MKNVISVLALIIIGGCTAAPYEAYKPEANNKDHVGGNGYVPKTLNINTKNEKGINESVQKKSYAATYQKHKDKLEDSGANNLSSQHDSPPNIDEENNSSALKNTKQKVKGSKAGKVVEKAIPESAKSAVKALKKLEAHCQAGISYRDYNPALGDATFEVNMFIESDDAKELQHLATSIQKVLQHYKNASSLWTIKFDFNKETYDLNSPLALSFFKVYPEANKNLENGGVLYWSAALSETKIIFSDTISYIFSEASKELTNSFALLNNKQFN